MLHFLKKYIFSGHKSILGGRKRYFFTRLRSISKSVLWSTLAFFACFLVSPADSERRLAKSAGVFDGNVDDDDDASAGRARERAQDDGHRNPKSVTAAAALSGDRQKNSSFSVLTISISGDRRRTDRERRAFRREEGGRERLRR